MTGPAPAGRLVLSVLIPARDEEGSLAATVEGLLAALEPRGIPHEILVVDDGSRDRTPEILRSIEARAPTVRHVRNDGPHGFGRAIRFGLERFEGDAVIAVMADGSDSPGDVAAFYGKLEEGFDMVFGSRFAPGATLSGYPRLKLVLNRLGNRLIGRLLGLDYDDFTNPLKCYRRRVIAAIQPLVSEDFNVSVEMSVKAAAAGFRFAVLPTDWHGRSAGRSKFRLWRNAFLYLSTVRRAIRTPPASDPEP